MRLGSTNQYNIALSAIKSIGIALLHSSKGNEEEILKK
jgi:hypothetical protein|tara:strand:+ start:24144 stop:24257 length:114 start_codon:yes stop_codon:yes gene_type:complete